MKKEKWEVFEHFGNGQYQVSTKGRVRTIYKNGKIRVLKSFITPFGYPRLQLYEKKGDSKSTKNFFVHRMVALCFIPNPDRKEFVNHINSKRHDCRVDNLEWTTRSENIRHGFDYGFLTRVGIKNSRAKITEKQVLEIFNMNGTLSEISKKYGLGTSAIHRIKMGVSWSHIKR